MQCGEDCGTGYLNGTGGVSNCQAGRLTDGPPRCGAEGFKMAPDVTLCADAMRWRDEPHALQPAYLLNDCIAHGVTTILNSASSTTNSPETASAARTPNIGRLKMNTAPPSSYRNGLIPYYAFRIPDRSQAPWHQRSWIIPPVIEE